MNSSNAFLSYTKKNGQCWDWTGYIKKTGYGQVRWENKNGRKAHRVSYELFIGKIHNGKTIDHLCRNRRCVNPEHLEVVSQRENTMRGLNPAALNSRKIHCPRCGGEYAHTTRLRLGKVVRERFCKKCKSAYHKQWSKSKGKSSNQ